MLLFDLSRNVRHLVLVTFGLLSNVIGQCQSSNRAALEFEAHELFNREQWEQAHQKYAELLSIEGTSAFLQMRYAATLLHDPTRRSEGTQRLAELVGKEDIAAECKYWWGRALMYQGESALAVKFLEEAHKEGDKKAFWLRNCELAIRQSKSLPSGFDAKYSFMKWDAIDVPLATFYRFIQWGRDGTRLMIAPEAISSKLDRKKQVLAPMVFSSGADRIFFHSYGKKGERGLDVWMAFLDKEGNFVEAQRLPDEVNSGDDDINPVWDAEEEVLYFASNRPGTLGGFDLFCSSWNGQTWSPAVSLGPLFNSVDNDWAYYPGNSHHTALLVTGREASFGGVEIWELEVDPVPKYPALLTTNWEVEGHMVPGNLILSDAESGSQLAEVNVSDTLGGWEVLVAAGQVIRYEFVSNAGQRVEGTFVVPQSAEAIVVNQTMMMKAQHGVAFLETQADGFSFAPSAGLQWSWESMNAEVVLPTWVSHAKESEESVQLEDAVNPAPRRIVQFVTYPWWTEEQKMERALAAHALSLHVNGERIALPDALDFNQWDAYEDRLDEVGEDVAEEAVKAILAKASAEVLLDETPWDLALSRACDEATRQWTNGVLDIETLRSQVHQRWAHSNALFDQGLLPQVKDKSGLVQDGEWVLAPWRDGRIRALEEVENQRRQALSKSGKVCWMLDHSDLDIEGLHESITDPSFWDVDSMTTVIRAELDMLVEGMPEATSMELETSRRMASNRLDEIRWRLGALDALEVDEELWSKELKESELKSWMSLAFKVASVLSELPKKGDKTEDNQSENSNVGQSWQTEESQLAERWKMDWEEWVNATGRQASNDDHAGVQSFEKRECLTFIQNSSETVWHPSVLAIMIQDHWADNGAQLKENENQEGEDSLSAGSDSLSDSMDLQDVLEDLEAAAHPGMSVEEASVLLQSLWMLSKWRHDDSWSAKSPEEIVPFLDEWHPIAEQALQKWRVEWAREHQVLQQGSQTDAVSDDKEEDQKHIQSQPSTQVEVINSGSVSQVEVPRLGETGMHLGWFLKRPQVPELPPRSRLSANQGKQGLTRWILVLPDNPSNEEMERINQWFVDTGLLEAYEVHWDGTMWSRGTFSGTREEVVLDTESNESQEGNWIEGTKRQDNTWGGDELWEHGAPVLLKNLRGTWYAVQVGAFRGEPEKGWIEMAGERLVYEPFPDGIARWYAGVRQDESSARERWQELHQHQPFQDAFVVRLTNGEREIIPLSDPSQPSEKMTEESAEETESFSHSNQEEESANQSVSRTEDGDDGETISGGGAAVFSDEDATGQMQRGTSQVQGTTWHVDIAKYYGTVPSSDVAVLLIRAADWGVRSVELFGQTTYFSRSYSNLQDALRVLEEVNQEGFRYAEIIQVN